jgi:hypothetical protein
MFVSMNPINITIEITDCQALDPRIPDSDRYMASLEGDLYRGTVVTAESLPEVLKEIGISLQVLKEYHEKEINE